MHVNTSPALHPKRFTWPELVALPGVLLWLFLLYAYSLYVATPEAMRGWWGGLGPLNLALDFLNPVYWSPGAFVASYGAGLGGIAWMYSRRRGWRAAVVVCGLAAIGFPLVMPVGYGHYKLPVTVSDEGQMRWVTEPPNVFSSSFKQAQQVHQAQCDYHLTGWSAEGELGYRSECRPGGWWYDPQADQARWGLFAWAAARAGSVTRWDGHTYLNPPAHLVTADGFPFLTLERAVSPDGRWEAVVVRRFYGPSDVVLVERAYEGLPTEHGGGGY